MSDKKIFKKHKKKGRNIIKRRRKKGRKERKFLCVKMRKKEC